MKRKKLFPSQLKNILGEEIASFFDCKRKELSIEYSSTYKEYKIGIPLFILDKKSKYQSEIQQELYNKYFVNVQLHALCPKLIDAELGDFVYIWSEYGTCIKDMPIGIVTSIYRDCNNTKWYKARGIEACSFALREYSVTSQLFKITDENYFADMEGFVKILSKDEAIEIVERKIIDEVEKHIEELKSKIPYIKQTMEHRMNNFRKKRVMEQLLN